MRSRIVGVLGVLTAASALASGCASSSGSPSSARFQPAPSVAARRTTRDEADSIVAQAFADREGPRVDINAEFTMASSSRRMRANFRVQDDAYVLIGHVDADGVVRIVFPNNPKDDGFVRGGDKRYSTSEFFAGFTDSYRFRYTNFGRYGSRYNPDAYDNGAGYLFIVASWRPMQFDKFATEGQWDSFETIDDAYARDPRPAVYELAALLAGENREAYTVKFARYFNTTYNGSALFSNAFSTGGICNASFNGIYHGFGFSSSFLPALMSMMPGDLFYYRGQAYAYDGLRDCAIPLGYSYPYAYGQYPRIAQGPGIPATPGIARPAISADNTHRNPLEPKPPVGAGRVAPVQAKDVAADTRHFSPSYRTRGLITEDENNPRNAQERTRPSIQQMTEGRTRSTFEGGFGRSSNNPRVGTGNGNNDGWNRTTTNERMRARAGNDNNSNGSYQSNGAWQSSRATDQGASRPTSSEGPRIAPTSMDTPRMAAPESRTAPASPPSAPAAPPASSTPPASSSTGRPTPR